MPSAAQEKKLRQTLITQVRRRTARSESPCGCAGRVDGRQCNCLLRHPAAAMTATTTTVVGTAAGTALFAARIVATRVAGSPAALAVVFLVIFVFLVFIGLFFAMAALVAWMQKVAQKYLALKELQVLTGEYMVKDLSELEKQYSNGQDLEQGKCRALSSSSSDVGPHDATGGSDQLVP